MWTSRKTDFRKLKITLVTMTYHTQRPECPCLSPHVLLIMLHNLSLSLLGRSATTRRRQRGFAIVSYLWPPVAWVGVLWRIPWR